MTYKEYLKTDYWKERKAAFKKRTWRRCFICHTKKRPLHTHHKRYERKGESVLFNERHTDFRLLCDICHMKIHKHGLEEYLINGKVKRRVLRNFLRTLH